MKILAVDTSSLAASAALWEEERLLGEFYIDAKRTHSQTILPMINALLQAVDPGASPPDLLAVSLGPGSFTGLRIGLSLVKGLAAGWGCPCIGVSTLEALAYNRFGGEGLVCPVMDARCQQVYTALFSLQNGRPTRLWEDMALPLSTLQERLAALGQPIFLVGDGAAMCYNSLKEALPVRLCEPKQRMQHAGALAQAAAIRYAEGGAAPGEALQPVYLRLSQAERERNQRLGLV